MRVVRHIRESAKTCRLLEANCNIFCNAEYGLFARARIVAEMVRLRTSLRCTSTTSRFIVQVAFVGSVLAAIRPELRNNERTILLQRLRLRPVYR